MTVPPVKTAGATIWTCDGYECGKRFNWGPRSLVYGSLKDEDESRWDQLKVYCGDCPASDAANEEAASA